MAKKNKKNYVQDFKMFADVTNGSNEFRFVIPCPDCGKDNFSKIYTSINNISWLETGRYPVKLVTLFNNETKESYDAFITLVNGNLIIFYDIANGTIICK